MVKIGIVGVGFMGVTHFKAVDKIKGGKVAGLVSRDEKKRRGDWRSVRGNFGGGGGVQLSASQLAAQQEAQAAAAGGGAPRRKTSAPIPARKFSSPYSS